MPCGHAWVIGAAMHVRTPRLYHIKRDCLVVYCECVRHTEFPWFGRVPTIILCVHVRSQTRTSYCPPAHGPPAARPSGQSVEHYPVI